MSGYIFVAYFNKSEKKEDFTCLLFVFLHIFAAGSYEKSVIYWK